MWRFFFLTLILTSQTLMANPSLSSQSVLSLIEEIEPELPEIEISEEMIGLTTAPEGPLDASLSAEESSLESLMFHEEEGFGKNEGENASLEGEDLGEVESPDLITLEPNFALEESVLDLANSNALEALF